MKYRVYISIRTSTIVKVVLVVSATKLILKAIEQASVPYVKGASDAASHWIDKQQDS